MRIDDDKKFMARALELAANGMGHTRPNPMVGAVLVKDGEIIGEGWHEFYGGPHAEVNAFADCRADPAGATLYVTLEPCCHYGKTPPCADLIASKNLERCRGCHAGSKSACVGKGYPETERCGDFRDDWCDGKEARVLNEVFMKFITEKKPFVLYKSAVSMDGKTACHTGKSQWISSEESREEVSYAARSVRGCHGRGGNDCRR
ncbi:MAG: bifunctional diaminohydroxyphosphoribosylaminopyrimidine deaminase/5-amino-6-(5-phosphoribosylamino)uracil reductase RibD [Dialister invisus]